jgi:MraZ protein
MAFDGSFDGTADYTLDAKNRLTVPARYRPALAAGLVLAKAIEPCIAIWPREGFDAYRRAALSGVHPVSRQATQIKRFLSANSYAADLDGAGRVMVPAPLMEHAGVKKDVTVIGVDDHLEVWDRAAWADFNRSLTEDMAGIAAGFDELGGVQTP